MFEKESSNPVIRNCLARLQYIYKRISIDIPLFDLRQKFQINNAVELVTNGAGDALYLLSTVATQFLQGREMSRG